MRCKIACKELPEMPHTIVKLSRFALVGLGTNVIDYAAFFLLFKIGGLAPVIAQVISYCVAAIFSFSANRHWTFAAHHGQIQAQAGMFILANILGVIASTASLGLLSACVGVWAAKILTTILLSTGFYLVSRFVIFKPVTQRAQNPAPTN
jgi:putative flippase GtrA